MDKKYLSHYLDWHNAGLFFIVSLIGLIVILAILFTYARSQEQKDTAGAGRSGGKKTISGNTCRIIESFYELVFSSTSILFFLAAYYLIDRFLTDRTYRVTWDKYSDIILMLFIFMSIFLNAFFDSVLVRLKWIDAGDKASIRLVSTIYMVLIFLYIRFIYDDLNYNELIVYFLGLVIGRFVYFDFTWPDFVKTMKGVARNMPMLILMLIYSGMMCFVGFKSKFLLTSNGVIVSILIAHVFMDMSIIIAHIILHPMTEKPVKNKKTVINEHTVSVRPAYRSDDEPDEGRRIKHREDPRTRRRSAHSGYDQDTVHDYDTRSERHHYPDPDRHISSDDEHDSWD